MTSKQSGGSDTPSAVVMEKVKVECDLCDGCGWYEGARPMGAKCERCEGLGYVWEEREKQIQHEWVIGEWKKEDGHRYYTRDDMCSLCGCGRGLVKSSKNSTDESIVHYDRSGQIFSYDNMPQCWGAKNPQ